MAQSLLLDRDEVIAVTGARHWIRPAAAWVAGAAGLLTYNWWALVPLKHGLLRSPDEFFSNLEVTGHPYAAVMQNADLLGGLLVLAAFLAAGRRSIPGGRREWLGMVIFAIGAGLGGLFPQVCTDGISASCLRLEWQFKLAASQYVHVCAGVIEFAAITFTLGCAALRTRGERTATAGIYRYLAIAVGVAYPFLFLCYVLDRFGSVIEAVFFVAFTAIALTQIAERTRRYPGRSGGPADEEATSSAAQGARLARSRGTP